MGEMLLIVFLEEVELVISVSDVLRIQLFLLLCFVNFSVNIQCHEWLISSPL